jgi:hypothetical protein
VARFKSRGGFQPRLFLEKAPGSRFYIFQPRRIKLMAIAASRSAIIFETPRNP